MQDCAELRQSWDAGPGGGGRGSTVPCAPVLLHAGHGSWTWAAGVGTGLRRAVLLCPLGRPRQLTATVLKSDAASRHEPACFGKLRWAQGQFLKDVVKQGAGEKATRATGLLLGRGLQHR